MAKKRQTPEEAEQALTDKGKSLFQFITGRLSKLGPPTWPVEFEEERYKEFNGNRETKEGVFVKLLDIHEQDKFDELARSEKRHNSPACVLEMVCKAACAFDGSLMFDKEVPENIALLVGESEFTRDIFVEAMYLNGYYDRPQKSMAKNSSETTNGASGSASANS